MGGNMNRKGYCKYVKKCRKGMELEEKGYSNKTRKGVRCSILTIVQVQFTCNYNNLDLVQEDYVNRSNLV